MMQPLTSKKEMIDQSAHAGVGSVFMLLLWWVIGTMTWWGAIVVGLVCSLPREHAQHGFHFTRGAWRDIAFWVGGPLVTYGLVLLFFGD